MVLCLICVCFEYSSDKLLEYSYIDIDNCRSTFNADYAVCVTDTCKVKPNSYNMVCKGISIAAFKTLYKAIIRQYDSVIVYMSGHGLYSGYLWHDRSVYKIPSVHEDTCDSSVYIMDICNANPLGLEYKYCKDTSSWNYTCCKPCASQSIAFLSSCTGIDSKMDRSGSLYSNSLFSLLRRVNTMSDCIHMINIYYPHSTVESSCYDNALIDTSYKHIVYKTA